MFLFQFLLAFLLAQRQMLLLITIFFFDYFHTDWDSSQDHIRSSHIHLHSFHKLVVLPKVIEINSFVCAIRTNPEVLDRVLNLP